MDEKKCTSTYKSECSLKEIANKNGAIRIEDGGMDESWNGQRCYLNPNRRGMIT